MRVEGERKKEGERERSRYLTLVKSTDIKSYIFLGFIFVLALALTSHADLAK